MYYYIYLTGSIYYDNLFTLWIIILFLPHRSENDVFNIFFIQRNDRNRYHIKPWYVSIDMLSRRHYYMSTSLTIYIIKIEEFTILRVITIVLQRSINCAEIRTFHRTLLTSTSDFGDKLQIAIKKRFWTGRPAGTVPVRSYVWFYL